MCSQSGRAARRFMPKITVDADEGALEYFQKQFEDGLFARDDTTNKLIYFDKNTPRGGIVVTREVAGNLYEHWSGRLEMLHTAFPDLKQ